MKKSKSSKSKSEPIAAKADDEDFLIVGIGASAGGIQSLKEFFANVSADSGAAYVVILHLSPDHESSLAEVLQASARIPVRQVTQRVRVEPNRVFVVMPNQSLAMDDGHIVVSPIKTFEERRAPVDIFFCTLAEAHHENAVCVVLSGTGADGSMGLKRVKENGGAVFAQNPRETEYSDMVRSAIATNFVDEVLNVAAIPAKIVAYDKKRRAGGIPAEPESRPDEEQKALREVFTQLRVRTGHDFSNYKRPTILRRIERRISVRNLADIIEYAAYLKGQPEEIQPLLKDLLISVTNFFRDKQTFAALEHDVIPRIVHEKKADEQIRVWVAGCATGEEAYSVAMLLIERRDSMGLDAPEIQIFASDIDEAAIATAREGFYTLNDAADVSPERLRRFFTKEGNGYRVRRELRETVLFANHNVLKDPPFSRLDLVTCRNMLIYLNPAAQKRVMEAFHFALLPGGFLYLGASESIDGSIDVFAPVSKENNIFQSRNVESRIPRPIRNLLLPESFAAQVKDLPANVRGQAVVPAEPTAIKRMPMHERLSYADLHQQLLGQFAPPSVVINQEHDILHLSERAGRFMQIQGGEPSSNLLKIVRPELRLELRNALYQAAQKRINVEAKNLTVKIDDRSETINIHVRPVLDRDRTDKKGGKRAAAAGKKESSVNDTARGFILVLFEKTGDAPEGDAESVITVSEPVARQLEEELIRVKAQLRASSKRYEIQTEELKASNEELQAMNEELRSSGEELETGKEELQSINEELQTVNQELKIKIEEILLSSNNLQNLINSTDIGTIFLDRNFRVQLFTPSARQIFNLIPTDFGRPLSDITHRLKDGDLLRDAKTVLETLQSVEREVRTVDNRVYTMRLLPYRTAEDRIQGTVITFFEVTERARAVEALRESEERLRLLVESAKDYAIFMLDNRRRVSSWNSGAQWMFGYADSEIIGEAGDVLFTPEDRERGEPEREEKNVREKGRADSERWHVRKDNSRFWGSGLVNPLLDERGNQTGFVKIMRDLTEQRQAEEALRQSETRFRAIVTQATAGIAEFDLAGRYTLVNETLCDSLGYTEAELLRMNLRDVMHPEDFPLFLESFERAIASGDASVSEKRIIRKNGTIIWITESISSVTDANGEPQRVAMIAFDITERKKIESALQTSNERLRLLIESASDYAIFTTTLDNRIDSWNTGAEKIFGWTEKEAVGQTFEIIFTPEDRASGAPEKEMAIALREGRAPDERFHLRRDGSRFYVSGVTNLLRDSSGNAKGFVKIARDMTKKLEAEKAVRDREMLQKLVGAQEDERKRIARDLHDELGQLLTGLRLKLEAVRKLCEDDAQLCGKVDETQSIAKQLDAGIDFLAWELRPAALDDLGLRPALAKYVEEWSHYAGVTAELLGSGIKRRRLAPEVETNLYRIAQEALNNIYKHAQAKSVAVVFDKRGDSIVLIIEDDGKGFKPGKKMTRGKGIGLIGMRERAALVGGSFEVESAPGKGTTVHIRVPAQTETAK